MKLNMTLNSLPPEVALHILSYLPVSSLANLHSVSRAWNDFLLHYESTAYRQAAFLHGIIHDDAASLDSLVLKRKYAQRMLRNVDSWKALCQIRSRIRNAWNGVAPSEMLSKGTESHHREAVHRIKVDEQRKLIMTTTGMDFPQVEVRDMETGRNLWLLEPSMGRMYAHLEYSNGFLIFDRSTGDREVWRLCTSPHELTHPVPFNDVPPDFDIRAQPDEIMREDSQRALQNALRYYCESVGPDFRPRGCFEPYALLRSPEDTRAYRFVYPTLMTVAYEKVYMWDVPSARIVEVVSGIQTAKLPIQAEKALRLFRTGDDVDSNIGMLPESTLNGIEGEADDDERFAEVDEGDDEWRDEDNDDDDAEFAYAPPVDEYILKSINYVDHSAGHIFLAGQHVLKVFTRAYTADDAIQCSQLALAIPSTKLRYGRWKYTIKDRGPQSNSALIPYRVEVSTMDTAPAVKLYDQFKAVHVSPSGSHLVALLNGVRLLVIPYFQKLSGQSDDVIYNHILDVQLGVPSASKSIYLAYEEGDGGEGKVGVVTSAAVFVVSLPYFPPDYSQKSPPFLRISRAKEFMDPDKLGEVSCLMLSDTRLFLNFDPSWSTIGIEERGRLLHVWERLFEDRLKSFQKNELLCYRRKMDAFFVLDLPDRVDFHPYSTVFEIDMLMS